MGIFNFFKKKKNELKDNEKPNKLEDSKPKEEVKPSELDTKSKSESLEIEEEKILYEVVIHDFEWIKNGEEDSNLSTKIFSVIELEFESNEELESYLIGIQVSEPDRFEQDMVQFINGEVENENPDEEIYFQGDGSWNNYEVFRTYEEASNLLNELIKKYSLSNDKDNWHPSNA
jgi:hypothetical protein